MINRCWSSDCEMPVAAAAIMMSYSDDDDEDDDDDELVICSRRPDAVSVDVDASDFIRRYWRQKSGPSAVLRVFELSERNFPFFISSYIFSGRQMKSEMTSVGRGKQEISAYVFFDCRPISSMSVLSCQ